MSLERPQDRFRGTLRSAGIVECLFCRIVSGHAAAVVVAETEDVIVIANRFPAVEGALLVVPRAHYDSVLEDQ
jgi:histidine triad (HIT) family protein